jgi:hypothetical protein
MIVLFIFQFLFLLLSLFIQKNSLLVWPAIFRLCTITYFFRFLKTNMWSVIVGRTVGPFKFCRSFLQILTVESKAICTKKWYCHSGISQICIFSRYPYGCPTVLLNFLFPYFIYIYMRGDSRTLHVQQVYNTPLTWGEPHTL